MKLVKNSLSNLGSSIIIALIAFVSIPLYIEKIGPANYGALAIIWLIIDHFSIFDFGLSRAVAHKISDVKDVEKEHSEIYWTALVVSSVAAIMVAILIYLVLNVLVNKLNIKVYDEVGGLQELIGYILPILPLSVLQCVLVGVVHGKEKIHAMSIINILSTLVYQLLPLVAICIYGDDIKLIILAMAVAKLAAVIILIAYTIKIIGVGRGVKISINYGLSLLKYAKWVSASSMLSPFLNSADRFLVGIILGVKNIAYYTIPLQLIQRAIIIPSSIGNAAFPTLVKKSDKDGIELVAVLFGVVLGIITPIICLSLLCFENFIEYWISAEFAKNAAEPGKILLFGVWFNSISVISYVQLQARGLPQMIAKAHFYQIIPYMSFLYFFSINFGIEGAATAYTLRCLLDMFLMLYFSKIKRDFFRVIITPLSLLVIAYILSYFADSAWHIIGVVSLAVGVVLWLILEFPTEYFKSKNTAMD